MVIRKKKFESIYDQKYPPFSHSKSTYILEVFKNCFVISDWKVYAVQKMMGNPNDESEKYLFIFGRTKIID